MENKPWYVGRMERKQAEKKLLHPVNDHGAFLIRDSESMPNHFSLSMRDGDTVKHYIIRSIHRGGFALKGNRFETLQDLVNHYTGHRGKLDGVKLRKAFLNFAEFGNNGAFLPNITDDFESDRDSVKVMKKLGIGRFGEVWEGVWNITTPVAIKSLLYEHIEPQHILDEAQTLKNLKHPNIIQLLAVCTLEEPIYIITELMINGNLLSYLRDKKRNDSLLSLPDIIRIASDVCRGMAYLAQEHYIHRDLKARKVLMGENNIVKIASFSSAKHVKDGVYKDNNLNSKILSKWAAPEVIANNVFSIKSDVWSFGILLSELITHGEIPYGEAMSEEVTMLKILQGYRMPPPFGCPLPLYTIMKECWHEDSTHRPSFQALQWKLEDFFTLDPLDYKTCEL